MKQLLELLPLVLFFCAYQMDGDTLTVDVIPQPTADAGSDEEACEGDAPFDLSGGTPAGGTWSGTGITDPVNGTLPESA